MRLKHIKTACIQRVFSIRSGLLIGSDRTRYSGRRFLSGLWRKTTKSRLRTTNADQRYCSNSVIISVI